MKNTNPRESMDAEGLPELEDRPPGIDVELDQDSVMVPRDHPVAVGDDPAYPTTPAEQRARRRGGGRARTRRGCTRRQGSCLTMPPHGAPK